MGAEIWELSAEEMGKKMASSELRFCNAQSARAEVPATLEFDDVFPSQLQFIQRSLRRLGVKANDLPDLCQEVLIVVYRKIREFEGRAAVRTWLFSMCWRVVSAFKRKPHMNNEVSLGSLDLPDQGMSVDHVIYYGQCWDHIDRAILALPQEQQVVFRMRMVSTESMREIAETLNWPIQTAFSRLSAACRVAELAVRQLDAEPAEDV